MPPKKGKGNKKKQAEEDEFEKLLSDLQKVTKQVGKEKQKELAKEEEIRKKKEEVHEQIAAKSKKNDLEQAFLRQKQQMEFQQLLRRLMAAQRPFLDSPNTEFKSEIVKSHKNFDVAVGEMQGWRNSMEDSHFIRVDNIKDANGNVKKDEGLFGVFDGHSGNEAAILCSKKLPDLCLSVYKDGKTDFEAAYLAMDALLEKEVKDGSGCTAVVVQVTPEKVTCASVGDSRAVLCRHLGSKSEAKESDEVFEVDGVSYEAIALSHDHKPEVEEEKARIESLGGFVQDNRVNGQLAMSRALGDFSYKTEKAKKPNEQLVIPNPTVIEEVRKTDSFVALACDGIFDVLSNMELCQLIAEKKFVEGMKENKEICEAICRRCLAPADGPSGQPTRAEGTDNMTIMIVDLK